MKVEVLMKNREPRVALRDAVSVIAKTALACTLTSTICMLGCSSGTTITVTAPQNTGAVSIAGTQFLRNGAVWVPHGLNSVAYNATPSTRNGLFGVAYNDLNASELASMQAWGADTVRFFVAQAALDSQDSLYDPSFLGEVESGVKAARAIGLNVIVCVQDESGTGEKTPTQLPNAGTGRAWKLLAPGFKGDNGIMFELMNEPQLPPSDANWAAWATTMNKMVAIIRNSGATNVLIADGLSFGEQLNGAPILNDPLVQVAYASHPYAHSRAEQTKTGWDAKFGRVSISSLAPVLVTEWSLENDPKIPLFQYCGPDSPQAGLAMLQYLQKKGIGLIALGYDLPNQPNVPRDGRATTNHAGTPSTLAGGVGCTDPTFGPGTIIQSWYRSGVVPPTPL
jgi:endoglucanase